MATQESIKPDEDQLAAITATDKTIRVIAGPGSGKTAVLAARIAHLIQTGRCEPCQILAMTFARKAAGEMRERVKQLLKETFPDPYGLNPDIFTIHGFGAEILRQNGMTIGLSALRVIDEAEQKQICSEVIETHGVESLLKSYSLDDLLARIYTYKNQVNPRYDYVKLIWGEEDYVSNAALKALGDLDKLFRGYLAYQRRFNVVDFVDLINIPIHILRHHSGLQTIWQQRYRHLLIDEAQDLTENEFMLLQLLRGPDTHLYMVGDPDQTVYSWRNANQACLIQLENYFPGTATYVLRRNYRSTPAIVELSNKLIAHNIFRLPKDGVAVKTGNFPVRVVETMDSKAEAEFIAHEVRSTPGNYAQTAVLFRNSRSLVFLESAFRLYKIPYRVCSGRSFFARAGIPILLGYLRFLVYLDDLSFYQIINFPARKIGDGRLSILRQYAIANRVSSWKALQTLADTKEFRGTGAGEFVRGFDKLRHGYATRKITDIIAQVLKDFGITATMQKKGQKSELSNIDNLKRMLHKQERAEPIRLPDYLDTIAIREAEEQPDGPAVSLMTIHAAKGLEFERIFLSGLTEGNLPSGRVSNPEQLEEERRLAYVAMTRAGRELVVTYPRYVFGREGLSYPSRFLAEIKDSKYMAFFKQGAPSRKYWNRG